MQSQYLTTRELASRWSLKPATLLAWRSRGIGPKHVKLGGAVRYSMADVVEFENRGAIARDTQEG